MFGDRKLEVYEQAKSKGSELPVAHLLKQKKDKGKQRDRELIDQMSESANDIWLAGLAAFEKAQREGGKVFNKLVKEGAGLVIVDGRGIVRYFTPDALSEEDMNTSVDLVRQHIEECVKVC